MARSSPFDAQTAAALIAAKAAGATHAAAAAKVGVAERTLRKWLAWGAAGREPFAAFATAFRLAEDRHRRERVAEITAEMQALAVA